jgi:hypothetical protein
MSDVGLTNSPIIMIMRMSRRTSPSFQFWLVTSQSPRVIMGMSINVDIRCVNIMDTANPYRGVTLEGPCPHKRTLYGSCPRKRTLGGYCHRKKTLIVLVVGPRKKVV